MVDTTKYAGELKDIARLAKEFSNSISGACGGSFEWGMTEMADSYLSIFDRFCPYKNDDRVELLRDVEIESSSGWYPCRHFLIRGAKATINNRGYNNGKFSFEVVFDDESWIDGDGNEKPVDSKHTFGLNETYFRKIYNEEKEEELEK